MTRKYLPNQNTNCGAHNQNRTDDLILTMDALYQLSYAGRIQSKNGAGDGNRTHVISLEGWSSTIELHPQTQFNFIIIHSLFQMVEGGGFEPPKAEPSDLQSDPFGHSGTPPLQSRPFCSNTLPIVNNKVTQRIWLWIRVTNPISISKGISELSLRLKTAHSILLCALEHYYAGV